MLLYRGAWEQLSVHYAILHDVTSIDGQSKYTIKHSKIPWPQCFRNCHECASKSRVDMYYINIDTMAELNPSVWWVYVYLHANLYLHIITGKMAWLDEVCYVMVHRILDIYNPHVLSRDRVFSYCIQVREASGSSGNAKTKTNLRWNHSRLHSAPLLLSVLPTWFI